MRARGKRDRAGAGFTIIEVMVAIMILSISVVSIYGVQFAAMATVSFSDYTTKAIQLARCRMSEIELEVQVQNGFEEGDVNLSGDCCELMEGDADEFSCRSEIKVVEIPDLTSLMTGASDGGLDAPGGMGMLGDMMGMGGGDTGGMGDLGDMGMMGMAASLAPMLSDMLKQAVRRVTVTVEWEQGLKKREFVLSQFLVHPTQGPLQLMNAAANAADTAEMLGGAAGEGISGDTSGTASSDTGTRSGGK